MFLFKNSLRTRVLRTRESCNEIKFYNILYDVQIKTVQVQLNIIIITLGKKKYKNVNMKK